MSRNNTPVFIFDLGGVLLDWNPRYVYRQYFDTPEQIERFLQEIDFSSWNTEQDRGRPFAEGVAALSSQFPQYARLIRAYHEEWIHSVAGPIQGTVDIVRTLKGLGYPLHALSNWSAETFPIARRRYDFLDLFDSILISGEVQVAKPDAQIFQILLQRIRRKAAECLLIDDSVQNTAAAERLGFEAIHFDSAEGLRRRLDEMNLLHANGRSTE